LEGGVERVSQWNENDWGRKDESSKKQPQLLFPVMRNVDLDKLIREQNQLQKQQDMEKQRQAQKQLPKDENQHSFYNRLEVGKAVEGNEGVVNLEARQRALEEARAAERQAADFPVRQLNDVYKEEEEGEEEEEEEEVLAGQRRLLQDLDTDDYFHENINQAADQERADEEAEGVVLLNQQDNFKHNNNEKNSVQQYGGEGERSNLYLFWLIVVSGVMFYAYNQLSLLILAHTSAITHVVLLTVRRAMVICLSVAYFGNPMTFTNWLGIAVASMGAIVYGIVKQSGPPETGHLKK
jgi:hypothetical protein